MRWGIDVVHRDGSGSNHPADDDRFDSLDDCCDDHHSGACRFHDLAEHAYIWTKDRDTRDALLGPMWWVEGGAEYMAQTASQRLRDSGALTASTWEPLTDRMIWKMEGVRRWMTDNGEASASTVSYGADQGVGYDYGTWAHAYLADRFGAEVLLGSFFANLNDLDWEGSFANTYGMSSEAFLDEFDAFVDLPIAEQLTILP